MSEHDDIGLGDLYEPSDPMPGGLDDVEGRARRRRRRRVFGGTAVAVIAAAVVIGLVLPGSGGPKQVRVDTASGGSTTVADQTTTSIDQSTPATSSPSTSVSGGPVPATPQAPTTTTPGSPVCDAATISAGLEADLGANASKELVTYGCSDNYAYAQVAIPPPASAAAGSPGVSENLLLVANGAAWEAVSQSTYCPSGSVPASVYQYACAAN